MKIAIVKLSALGDIVHSMIVLQFIKRYDQEIKVDWVVEESYKELLEYHPDINKVHVVNIKKAKNKKSFYLLINELRKVRQFGVYDLVIDLQGLLKSALISRLIPSSITIGFDKYSSRESASSAFYNKTFQYSYKENIIERNFGLIKFALGLPSKKEEIINKLPFLYTSEEYLAPNLSSFKKNILLIPSASIKSKRYSPIKLAELTTMLDANYLIIWGDHEEKTIAEEVKALSPQVNICDKLTLQALISLILKVDLVVGPDTGPTHMAWALNIPSITLFGTTPGYRNAYSTKINKIIESHSEVNPLKIDKQDYSINDIKVLEVVNLAQDLLK